MKINNFKELEKLEMEEVDFCGDKILSGITSDIGIFRYITEIIEVYIPKIFEMFVDLTGGKSER